MINTMGKIRTHFWIYAIAVFISQLDGGTVSTLLPSITKAFDLSSITASWIAGIYTLGLVVGTPIASNLSDIHGAKKVFLGELIIWFIGTLLTASAPIYPVLLLGRFIQALGDCGIIVLSINIMLHSSNHQRQGRRVSVVGIVSGLSSIFGPIFVGLTLAMTENWRTFYYSLLPFIAILFLLVWYILDNETQTNTWRTDFFGLSTFTVFMTCIMLILTFAQRFNLYSYAIYALVFIGLISLGLFLRAEHHVKADQLPFLPIQLLKKSAYSLTLLLGLLGGTLFSVFIYIPTYIHTVFQLPMRLSGMTLVITGLGSVIGSWIGGLLVDKLGNKKTLIVAASIIGLSGLLLALNLENLGFFAAVSFFLGIGLGSFMSAPLQVIAGRMAGQGNHMQAIGGLSTTKKIGATIAPLIYASVIQLNFNHGQTGAKMYQGIFILLVVIAVLSILITSLIPFKKEEKI
ncbi:MFS transporter [Agrilactobacillus fermenti]|uniref:MFS transporter n=1 Tax=Agrilactobacillus fermenti TaxID=2586909 RepID=UPI001E52A360|nr:MFS transporter [Agrilactobacillus fermenti]MCD2256728.1 MFS transporter [Agrilactobacillus fermenti]